MIFNGCRLVICILIVSHLFSSNTIICWCQNLSLRGKSDEIPQGGFLILGHDVDKYTPSASQLWDQVQNTKDILIKANLRNFLQFGFEKMQSFSGALSQLNFWSKKLSPSQMKALAQCSGEQTIHSINNAWNITKWLSEGKIWAHYFIGCWLTRQSINQNWTTSINTIPGQGIDKNIDGAHKFEDVITFCSIPFHVSSHQCFVFYDLWKWANFSRVES